MSTSIAHRLRTDFHAYPDCMEAADEIERLQSALGKSAAHVLALRAEVEAHKRSRQIDANEARSREQELRAEVERLKANAERYQWMKRVHADGDESVTEWIGFYAADQWDEEIDRERLPSPTTEVPK